MMISDLRTAPVQSSSDVRAFFNRRARSYSEQHGHPQRLLEYRIRLIKKWAALGRDDVVLDIGCGNGHHLMALGGDIGRGIGIDVSEAMVKLANTRREAAGGRDNITFRVDNGEKLPTIEDESMDVAMCIGSLEHMLDQPMVVEHAYRVLKPRGRFICLTPNGNYVWYRSIAPAMGIDTKHLSTDTFLTEGKFTVLLEKARFSSIQMAFWKFIPRGDVHPLMGTALEILEAVGKLFGIKAFRGGLIAFAEKP